MENRVRHVRVKRLITVADGARALCFGDVLPNPRERAEDCLTVRGRSKRSRGLRYCYCSSGLLLRRPSTRPTDGREEAGPGRVRFEIVRGHGGRLRFARTADEWPDSRETTTKRRRRRRVRRNVFTVVSTRREHVRNPVFTTNRCVLVYGYFFCRTVEEQTSDLTLLNVHLYKPSTRPCWRVYNTNNKRRNGLAAKSPRTHTHTHVKTYGGGDRRNSNLTDIISAPRPAVRRFAREQTRTRFVCK